MANARKDRFDAIVVGRIDRFARSTSHVLKTLVIFDSLGIEFVSLCENADTSTPAGKLVFVFLSDLTELERV
jgi:site-specific DNA recombinase